MGAQPKKDAFDRWWEWANKSVGTYVTIPADIHNAIMELSPEDRLDREKVNEAMRRYARFEIVRLDHDLHLDPDSGCEQA